MNTSDEFTARVDKEGIKVGKVGEIVNQIVNQAHVVVSIKAGKLYPITAEDLVIGEENPKN